VIFLAKYYQWLIVAGLVLALGASRWQLSSSSRKVALTEEKLAASQAAFAVEHAATADAIRAGQACVAEVADRGKRSDAVAGVLRAQVAKYRAAAEECKSSATVAARMGALFPVKP